MKSRISFFNGTALGKDITRFLPVWLVYTMLGLTSAQSTMSSYLFWDDIGVGAYYLATGIGGYAIINLLYALLTALMLFGDLFNSKLCNALHSLPLRRESWFVIHCIAGIGFSVIPNILIALSMMPYLGSMWYVSLIWLLGMVLEYVFFFGLAVFCAMCTGSRFGMAALYTILNFLSMLIQWFVITFYEPLLYGVSLESSLYQYFSPVVGLMSDELELVKFEEIPIFTDPNVGWQNFEYRFQGMSADWWYPAVLALAGIGLLVAAILLYRRRKLESAGDFIVIRPMAVGFSVVYTLCIGALFQLFTGGSFIFLIAGILVGFMTGQMLLERTVKVFHKRFFLKLGIVVGALIISLITVALDPLGVVEWTPMPQQVQSVSLNDAYDSYGDNMVITGQDKVEGVIDIHQQLLDDRVEMDSPLDYIVMLLTGEEEYVNTLHLTYTLDNGRQVSREYYYNVNSDAAKDIARYLSLPEYVLGYEDWNDFLAQVTEVYVDGYEIPAAQARELLTAIKSDCEAGTMAQDYMLHPDRNAEYYSQYWVDIYYDNGFNYISLNIFCDAENTLAWINAHPEIFEETATEWEDDQEILT